ncbi:MAG: acylneuraminate cytidylyltransferase family protein [Ignavibacteriaceae bacterium]
MINDQKTLALIPARGGSKGVPQKNIKNLNGKPLIAWTIETALQCKYIDRIVVSTDDEKIASIAKQFNADVPFLRPKELAQDNSKSIDAVLHCINWLKENGDEYDILILLQPTSPLRIATDIDKSIEMLFEKKADSIVSVCKTEHNPLWSNTLPNDGRMNRFLKNEFANLNRQQLPQYYRLNGAVYSAWTDYVVKNLSFFGKNTFAYIMSNERSIDVDSSFDFELCEFFMKSKGN